MNLRNILLFGLILFMQSCNPGQQKESAQKETTFLQQGGWCWFQDPRAIINNGKLIVGGVDGQNGDIRLGIFDLETEKPDGELTLHGSFEADDHDAPALYARPDGSILAMWAKHGNEKIHYYNISAPDNYLEWGERREFHHDYVHDAGVTYMNLFLMEDEGLLYSFFRDGPSYNPSFITSPDHGETWGQRTHFIENDVSGRNRPYARYVQINENAVGISYTDAHPRVYGNSLYYAAFSQGGFYNVRGEKIKNIDAGPLGTSQGEKIFTGSQTKQKPEGYESVPNSAWTCAMAKDEKNHPHIGYSLYLDNNDHRFRIASWDGTRWHDREIAYAGKCLYQKESSYTGLMAFDPTDPGMVYISTDVHPSTGEDLGGKHEIYAGEIKAGDDISTIKWTAITAHSEHRNIRPMVLAKEGYKVLVWLKGEWNTYVNYDVDVVGKILQKAKQ